MARQWTLYRLAFLFVCLLLNDAQGNRNPFAILKKTELQSWLPWALRRHRGARQAAADMRTNTNNLRQQQQQRRTEDGNDNKSSWNNNNGGYDFSNDAEYFGDMFVTAPREWTALEWGLFAAMVTSFAIAFFCCCILVIIPRCCGRFGATMYAFLVTS